MALDSESQRDMARIRATLVTIIVVAGALAVVEALMARSLRTPELWLLAAVTGAFSTVLLRPLWLNGQGRTGTAVLQACLAILAIQTAYLVLYPRAYPAISIASIVVVALAITYVRGRALFGVVVGSWAVSAASILWGVLGPGNLAVPPEADVPILLGSGLAAVTVGMVLLWQFADHMTRTLDESRAANAALSRAHEKTKGLEQLKSRFINSAAHELNTPLTPVMLQLQLLQHRAPESDATQRRSLAVLERNLNRINGLVHEMLDVARLQAGRLGLKREAFDLREAVEEAADDYAAIAQDAGVGLALAPDGPVRVTADRRHVAQILSNLLSNAIRLTPRGGSVTVTTAATAGGGEVRVADTGVGLSDEQMQGLFQPFSRLHDEAVAGKGSGLGLYISRALADEMGGTLSAESDGVGRGAAFVLRVPLEKAVAVPA